MNCREHKICFSRRRSGVALILVIVVLVVLTVVVYKISSSISRWKHRQQYIIDYQTSRYACESGLKYALVTVGALKPNYVSRPNEPDFSDLFNMSDEEYKQMMEKWAQQLQMEIDANNLSKNDFASNFIDFRSLFDTNDVNGVNDANHLRSADANNQSALEPNDINSIGDINDMNALSSREPNKLFVPGPYGPPWPYVTEPVEIEFGDARLMIEIIDENAKLPLSWGTTSDPNMKSEAKAAVVTFCEWMKMEPNEVEPLLTQLDAVKEIKPFSMNLKPVVTATTQQIQDGNTAQPGRASRRTRTRRATSRTVQETRPDIGHTRDFAKLLHSQMIDLEKLAKPVNEDENRLESALKYISLWGTSQVNINSAPRQVLEAAFAFGGDGREIADEIIKQRRIKPFSDIDDLKKRLFSYNTSIEKSRPYLVTQSDFFSIRVTATSGVARISATAGLKKEGDSLQKIGIIIE